MRKFLSFAAVLALLSGCAQSDGVNDRLPITVDTPETLYAEFDNERGENEDETRTYVEDEWMLRWHEGDEISFFPVTYNMCYRFNGQTGDNGGTFSKLTTDIVTGNELPTRYAVYPYREDTKISDEGHITYYFPEEQQWAEKSFGRGANVMVAATENHDDNVLRFKNVGGYLKLQIYSSEQRWLDYLVLEGNNGERIAGEARIEAYYDGEPWVEMTENASTRITYDCVDTQHWVDLAISTDAENPTDLWIVLPPTYFDNGITVRIYDTEGNVCTKSTNNWIPIDRNYVQPLSTFEFVADGDNGGEEDAQIKIYGDVSATGWMNCNAWIWDDGGANYTGGSWPGLALEAEEVDGKMYYAFEVAPEMVGSTVNVIFNNGSEQTVDINGVELNDDVFITLTEVDASGKWLATVAYSAGEDEPVERSIVLNNVEHDAISFTVNHTGDYYLWLVEEEYLSWSGQTIDEFIAVFGVGAALVKASGTQSFDWHDGDTTELNMTIDIASDRAYYLAVAEFVDGTLVEGSIITTQFRTLPTPESSSEVAVELSDVTATSVYITATPDASIVQYYIYVRDRSWADGIISGYGESMLQNLVKNPNAGAWNLTEAYEGLWEGLSANTEYYLMVLAIDGDGAENFKYTSFTTGDEASDDTPGEDEPVAPEGEVPYNQIWYTTTDESLLVPNNDDFGGAAVVSNTYENGLGVITFDRNIYRVGDGTFSDKHNLLTINLPNCVTNLAAWTFAACSNLREFVIPTSIEDLGAYTFSSCHSLQSVTFPEHTFYYGFCIFEECENISAFYGGGVLSDNRCYAPNGHAEFIATAGITEYAFPDEVIGVGQFAFDMPNNIEVLIINDNLEWFGCNLRFCDDLREFRGAHTTEDGYAIIIADVLHSVVPNGISEYTVPDGVRVIGDMAFMCHENITKITLPESVREIDGFYGCSNLESINIPAGVTRICSQSFEGCELLSSIELPVGLTTIEHGTFNGCTGLTEIVIPRKVSRIDEYAFYNCTNLVSVRLECVTPPELQIDWTGEAWPFDNNAPGRIIYVPNQSVDAYMAAEGWSNYAYSIVGYEYDEPVIPVNPENCEWANVYLSLPTEEDAANGFYPYQNIYITIEGTDIVAGRIALVYADDTSVEDTLTNWGQSLDASWLETINSGSVLGLVASAGPSLECRVVTELTNVNGDVVRFDQYITTDPLPEVHPSMDQWVGTWSLSAEQMINWTYADGAYNGPTIVDGAVTRDITIEAATDIAYDCVRVYGLTSLTTSNGEPIPAFATVTNDRTLWFQSGTLSIEQINDEEFTYWLPYVQTSNGVEAIPATPFTWQVALSEDGLTATTYFMGTVYYEDESRSSLGMDVFAYNFNTGAVRPIYDPETMPEVITPAGNITMTRTSSAAKASYAPAKRAATRNMVQIELVK